MHYVHTQYHVHTWIGFAELAKYSVPYDLFKKIITHESSNH